MKEIKKLHGHSGSKVSLMEDDLGRNFIRKIGNIERNFERLSFLHSKHFNVPRVDKITDDVLYMDYIHGLDMQSYIKTESNVEKLALFINEIFADFSTSTKNKSYTKIYEKNLMWLRESDYELPFSVDELIKKLPKILPKSNYHGDFTLDNLIYSDSTFYMIDAVTTDYDSYVFDIAKLRQDLDCRWFLRDSNLRIGSKVSKLKELLELKFKWDMSDDYLLILMLLRVYKHTQKNDSNYIFLLNEMRRLWK